MKDIWTATINLLSSPQITNLKLVINLIFSGIIIQQEMSEPEFK